MIAGFHRLRAQALQRGVCSKSIAHFTREQEGVAAVLDILEGCVARCSFMATTCSGFGRAAATTGAIQVGRCVYHHHGWRRPRASGPVRERQACIYPHHLPAKDSKSGPAELCEWFDGRSGSVKRVLDLARLLRMNDRGSFSAYVVGL